ncbi:MAG: hypothetical protein ACD_33C00002G0034 [uncultured bacterium]|nr:MAG: hypothetical protein ACD_33C00002G0034 [uncultured bacterium]
MKSLTPKEILNIDLSNIWTALSDKKYSVVYEDKVKVINTNKEIIFNRYCWILFSLYPSTPIPSTCNISHILNGNFYNADTHVKLLEAIFGHIVEYNNITTYTQKEPLLKLTYQIVNLIYNDLIYKISSHVTTINAIDFVEVVNMTEIKDIHGNIKANPDSIDKAYKSIKKTLTGTTLVNNRFIHAYKSKSVNENQSNQCIGPRGFVTDIDRTVFKQPILNGFIRGLHNLFEIVAESRTAAKALNASDNHIKTSEYASRRLQLLTMTVTNVVYGDCGSTDYFNILIIPVILENIKGKYYLDEDTNTLKYFKGNESHLFNKIVKLRSTLGCKVVNPKHVCSTCLGKLSENFKENSNLGYTATAYLMEKASQSILSTKHLTHSVRKSSILLEGHANKYFAISTEDKLYISKDINTTGLFIILPSSQLPKLTDVLNLTHVCIGLNKIGEVSDVIFRDSKHKTPISENVDISYKDRNCILTKEFLDYIKCTNIESDSRSNFVVPLDKWNKEQPMFFNPLKENNIISFISKLTRIIETNNDKVKDPYEKLDMLLNHVITQFKCNITILEILIYATTTYNVFNNNYRLGRNSQHLLTESETNIFRNRSLSQLFVFEDQVKSIYNNGVNIFINNNRHDHVMDWLFAPSDILNKEMIYKHI